MEFFKILLITGILSSMVVSPSAAAALALSNLESDSIFNFQPGDISLVLVPDDNPTQPAGKIGGGKVHKRNNEIHLEGPTKCNDQQWYASGYPKGEWTS